MTDAAGSTVDSGDATMASGCAGLPLCDDFDSPSDTPDRAPNPSLWTLIGTAGCGGNGNPSAPTIYPIMIDSSQFHSPPNSVKVVGGDSCGPFLVDTSAFSKLSGGELYGRFYVHLSDTAMTFDHTALMGLGLLTDGGVGFDVQNGQSILELGSEGAGNPTNILMWQLSDDSFGTLPAKNAMAGAQSTYVAANGFTCIEFHTSAATSAIQTWVNGTLVPGLTDPPAPLGQTKWMPPSPLSPTSFALGWRVYSGESLTAWFDDVALSNARIGCQ